MGYTNIGAIFTQVLHSHTHTHRNYMHRDYTHRNYRQELHTGTTNT